MSFPSQPPPTENRPFLQSPSGTSPRRRPIGRLIGLFLLAGFIGWLIVQSPLEMGRWHLAWALKLRAENDKDGAYRELEAAMKKYPQSAELMLKRAEWKFQDDKREEALADCNRAIELAGDSLAAHWLRGQVLFKAREFARAVEDFKKVENSSRRTGRPPRSQILNELAYTQALANSELDEALVHANRALELQPDDVNILDTRGYIHYQRGNLDAALEDMNAAVEGIDAEIKNTRPNITADGGKSRAKKSISSASGSESAPSARSEAAAVIHYHRALVLQALDREEDAEKDLAAARELAGREPDETLF